MNVRQLMTRNPKLILTMVLAAGVFSACGGGGGGGGGTTHAGPTTAVLTLSTQGTSTNLGGLGVTVVFPTGVSVKTDAAGNVDSTVVTASGVAGGQAAVISLYSPATSTAKASLSVVLAGSTVSGFGVGEFATVKCTLNSGSPVETDFGLEDFQPVDVHGSALSGLTASFSVVIQ